MSAELRAMGAQVHEKPDGLAIEGLGHAQGNGRLRGTAGKSHGDHRVAMSIAVAGLTALDETRVHGADCIETSFPDFDRVLLLLTSQKKGV